MVGAFYYLRVVKVTWFDDPVQTAPVGQTQGVNLLLAANGAAVLSSGCSPAA